MSVADASETGRGPARPAELRPWDQQPGEPDHWYAAFSEYLAQGRRRSVRTAVAARRAAGAALPGLDRCRVVAVEWEWHRRATVWDEMQACAVAQPNPTAPPDTAAPPEGEQLPVAETGQEPWAQQPGEPDIWYATFRRYLALGRKRSCRAARQAQLAANPLLPSESVCERMSAAWHWRERAAAWDTAHRAEEEAAAAARPPWMQQPRESDRWYAIFRRYVALGPTRSIYRIARICIGEDPNAPDYSTFYDEALRRRWEARAEAWDLQDGQDDGDADLSPATDGQTFMVGEPPQPWDLQPSEPPRLFGYFCHYLELGPGRSVARAFRDLNNVQEQYNGVSAHTYALTRRWKWEQRAAAWDAHLRDLLAVELIDLRTALAEHRLAVAEVQFDEAICAVETANVGGMTEEEARRRLGILNRMVIGYAAMQRAEFDYLDKLNEKRGAGEVRMTADVLDAITQQVRQREAAKLQVTPPRALLIDSQPNQPAASAPPHAPDDNTP